ncbi:MAG: CRISPR-associated ring nuclease Crn3/Csx3 [Candidatus Baldrarchaeia archaeon]
MILLNVVISGNGIILPQQLPSLLAKVATTLTPEREGTEGVVISGRLPVWAYAALTHQLHPFKWVGTFEPRMGKAVIVASHTPTVNVGDVVEIKPTKTVDIVFP